MTTPLRIAVIAADFNKDIVNPMISAAEETAAKAGATTQVIRIPGCYEMPVVCAALITRPDVDLVVALGYIERGETLHGEVMGHVVHDALVSLQIECSKPVGIGIIGPGATLEQAQKRNVNYAIAAVEAALQTKKILDQISL